MKGTLSGEGEGPDVEVTVSANNLTSSLAFFLAAGDDDGASPPSLLSIASWVVFVYFVVFYIFFWKFIGYALN